MSISTQQIRQDIAVSADSRNAKLKLLEGKSPTQKSVVGSLVFLEKNEGFVISFDCE